MASVIFLKELAKHWREVGAVAPSSRFLVDKMLSKVDFKTARRIVELGPGTGPMTKEILSRLHADGHLVAVESNETFCDMLRKINDPRLSVECVSAVELSSILAGKKADAIISGIPLAVVGKEVVENILDEVKKNLAPGGVFVQFQYSLTSKKTLKTYFQTVHVDFVPMNVPPAFVYTVCR